MDVEMTLPLPQRPIPDGALGDDERTETEKSPLEEAKSMCVSIGAQGHGMHSGVHAISGDSEMDDEGASPDGDLNGKCRKHRRGKNKGGNRHRSWKPYAKMSWDERQVVDERETRRAYQRREQRFKSGHPVAPYNTTQFLMEQHPVDKNKAESDRNSDTQDRDPAGSASPLDSYSGSESFDSQDEDIFLEKDFSETYETYHAARLQDMSKEELIKELLDLESRVERHHRSGRRSVSPPKSDNNNIDRSASGSLSKDMVIDVNMESKSSVISDPESLKQSIKFLQDENDRLRRENEELKKKGGEKQTTEG